VLDPLIYLEYIGVPDFSTHAVEFKLILAIANAIIITKNCQGCLAQ